MTNKTITIKKPFDSHVHLRRGATLRAVTKYTAERFGRGIIMPNTDPPIDTVEQALDYRNEIISALSGKRAENPEMRGTGKVATEAYKSTTKETQGPRNEADGGYMHASFAPLMTFYLTKKLSPKDIEKGASGDVCKIYAVKSYPYGATTNSQWGYRNILEAKDVLKEMERAGMPLLLHGEVHLNSHDEEEDPYDGERMFVADVLPRLLEMYPKLKVSLEHMSSAEAIDFMEKNGAADKLVTTVTPHHLMYDRRQAFSGGYRSLLHCKPLVKTAHDKERLLAMVKKGLPFVSAGTDTAPHPESKKFSSCCAFGVFNVPVALELYTQVFDELGCLDKLEGFLSVNGPRFFGLKPATDTITLVKEDWQVTEPVVTEEEVKIWSICDKTHGLGNEVIHWRIADRLQVPMSNPSARRK